MNRDPRVYKDPKQLIWWGIPILVVVAIAVALYYGRTRQADVAQEQVEPEPVAEAEPPIKYPVEEAVEPEQPLPPLGESDPVVQESLTDRIGPAVQDFLVPKSIVRHFVVTVDNLPRKKAAVQMWPVKPAPGEFQVRRTEGDEIVLSEKNYARYEPMVKLVQSIDADQVAAMYRRFYPLMQQAYVDLGYPEGYFNDRLVEVIDHLLATPDVTGPIKLTYPTVRYHFADPSLEERSAGQKVLIRIGPDNRAAVKAKLRELREVVAQQVVEENAEQAADQPMSGTGEAPRP